MTLPVIPPEKDGAVTIPEKVAPPYTFKVTPVPTFILFAVSAPIPLRAAFL